MKKIIQFIQILSFLTVSFLLIISFTPLPNFLAEPLTITPKPKKADVILVLSGGVYPNGSLSYFSLERVVRAVSLYNRGFSPKIILSGGISMHGAKISDAEAMAKAVVDLGVKKDDIILEKNSRNTLENLKYSQKIIKEKKFSTVLLVTSAIHTYRSMEMASNLGLKLIPASAESFDQYRVMSVDRCLLFYFSAREYGALLFYRLRGFGD